MKFAQAMLQPPVPPGLGVGWPELCSDSAQAVTAPGSSAPAWLSSLAPSTLALLWALYGAPGFQLRETHCVASATRIPLSGLCQGPHPASRSAGADGSQPHSLSSHLEEGGRDEQGKPLGTQEADCGLSAAPQCRRSWAGLTGAQRLTLQSKGGLGKTRS